MGSVVVSQRQADAWARANHGHSLLAGFVQFLQYYYQSGCLYRLRALGERHNMDLTVGKLGSSQSQRSCCHHCLHPSLVLGSLGALVSGQGSGDSGFSFGVSLTLVYHWQKQGKLQVKPKL